MAIFNSYVSLPEGISCHMCHIIDDLPQKNLIFQGSRQGGRPSCDPWDGDVLHHDKAMQQKPSVGLCQAYSSGNIPRKYGQKYGTNVAPF